MHKKKRKFETGRQAANTKLVAAGEKRVRPVRTRGGNIKWRALRLESGNFSWGTQGKQYFQLYTTASMCGLRPSVQCWA